MNNIDFISDWASFEDSIRPLAFEHTSQALIVIDPHQNRFIDFNIRENNKITNSMGNVESGYYPSFENKYLYLQHRPFYLWLMS